MSAKSRKNLRNDEDTQDFTVHTSPTRQRAKRAAPEEGLSVAPEELGTQFMSGALEQGNFEGELEPDLSLNAGAASDEALPDADGGTVWDQTVRRSDIREIRDVAIRGEDGVDPDLPDDQDDQQAPRAVDMHVARVVGASLFDSEDDETGEVRSPDISTDDQER